MKRLLLITNALFIFLGCTFSIRAQENTQLLPGKSGKIFLINGDIVEFENISQTVNGFTYSLKGTDEEANIHNEEVYEIEQYTGNRAAEYAASCALGGLLGAILGTLDWDETNGLENAKTPFIIGATIGSGVIGAFVGAKQKKTKLVFSSEQISWQPIINAYPDKTDFTCSVGVRFTF